MVTLNITYHDVMILAVGAFCTVSRYVSYDAHFFAKMLRSYEHGGEILMVFIFK